MNSGWASRKFLVTGAAMILPAVLLGVSAYVLIAAPERASLLTGVMAAVSAALSTAAGAVYVITEGRIDLRAVSPVADELLETVADLAEKSASLHTVLVEALENAEQVQEQDAER